MKWDLKEPRLGDAVRVKLGGIYHYGILVGEDEIVQFGLPPNTRQELNAQDIKVCSSNVQTFLQGGFLERGIPEKKDGKKRKPNEVVEYAISQAGRGGYHILRNNCEHFVYECVFGQKKSEQTDTVRDFFANLPIADVYTAIIPESVEYLEVYPSLRQEEISSITNEKVKKEKYCAWKLLEYALMRTFGYKLSDLEFTKTEDGKWLSNKCYFSISHSNNLVAVAVSKKPIGVDCEIIREPKTGAIERVLSRAEKKALKSIEPTKKTEYLLSVWSKKESAFKRMVKGKFLPSKINTFKYDFAQKTVEVNGDLYTLNICSEFNKNIRYFERIDF